MAGHEPEFEQADGADQQSPSNAVHREADACRGGRIWGTGGFPRHMPPMNVRQKDTQGDGRAADHQAEHLEPDDFVDQCRATAADEEDHDGGQKGPHGFGHGGSTHKARLCIGNG